MTDQIGSISSESRTFTCLDSTHKGFVRSNQTNYLHFDDGTQYIPVGENMAWQNNNAFVDFNKWLTALSDNGGNFIRLWHAHWGLGIEWENGWNNFSGLRRYKETNMAFQDWMFDYCADRVHTIRVDNTGIDWVTIAAYTFTGLGSTIDAYVLQGDAADQAAGWVLNKAYNHVDVVAQGVPDPVAGGVLNVDGFANGGYSVFWYDCLSGAVVASETVFADNNRLQVPIPDLYWDLAFRVEGNPLGGRVREPALAFTTYPNPAVAGGLLTVQPAGENPGGTLLELVLYDASGKPLLRKRAAATSG